MFQRLLRGAASASQTAAPDERAATSERVAAETDTVRRIVARLESLPPDEARFLAGFAYVMSRAANADLDISDTETRVMEQSVVDLGGLDEAQAVLVVEMAKIQARNKGGTEDFLVTREFAQTATPEQKREVLHCCFGVAVADGSISSEEASVVNEIARELDVSREDLNRVREEFVDRFAAIRAMHRLEGDG